MSRASKWAKALFQPKAHDDIPVKIVLTASHTGNAIEVFASDGVTSLFSVSPAGAITPAAGVDLADTFTVHDPAAVTQKVRLDAGAVTAGQTRVLASPDFDGILVTTTGVQTCTNKTLTAPKVGTAILDVNGLELLKVTATATAVNELTLANAAANGTPAITATGDDAIVSIEITPKSTGRVVFGQRAIDLMTATVLNTASDQTYAVAALLGGLLLRDPNGSARADKLPAAATLLAACVGAKVGSAIRVTVRNTADAAETITITGADGTVTLSGSGASTTTITVAQNASKTLLLVFTNIGGGTEAYTAFSEMGGTH